MAAVTSRFPVRILIAPNAFKGAQDASAAAAAIARGLRRSRLKCVTECFPIGDGGDGTAKLFIQKCGGKMVPTRVHDPLGRTINASFGLIDRGRTAVIELADASGLRLLKRNEFDPLHATTFGTGELIRLALDKGVRNIILGVGGSATVDGGVGILQALGVHFLDADGKCLAGLPGNLGRLESLDLAGLDKRIRRCTITIPCDVVNPLLGKNGAAKIFGPQKGASASDVKKLEAGLKRLSQVISRQAGKNVATLKHGGAAGGVPAGLYGLLNAKLTSGIDHFLGLTGFDAALRKADLVITGEGTIDEQTFHGKGPFGVAVRAGKRKIPVAGFAGRVLLKNNSRLRDYFEVLLAISDGSLKLETAIRQTAKNLEKTAKEFGNFLAETQR